MSTNYEASHYGIFSIFLLNSSWLSEERVKLYETMFTVLKSFEISQQCENLNWLWNWSVLNKLWETLIICRRPKELRMTQFDVAYRLCFSVCPESAHPANQPDNGVDRIGSHYRSWLTEKTPHQNGLSPLSNPAKSWSTPGNARTGEREDEVDRKGWEQRMSWENEREKG